MTPVRLGIIGVGDVAERDYLPEWHRLGGEAVITVVCGRNPERAERVAAQHEVDRWSTNYLDVVQSDVDAIVNLTPISVHYPVTLAALEAGKHVYTEKPMASSPAQAKALEQLATQRGLALVCAPSIMLFPQVVKVRQLLSSGELGAVRAARAQALTGPPPWPGYGSDPSFFFEDEAGPLIDMGVYPLHVLTGLLGPASSVAAMASRTMQSFIVADGPFEGKVIPVQAEDTWQVIASLGGCLASVEANFSTAMSAAADCELRGERGAVAFSLFDVSAPVSLLPAGHSEWTEVPVAHERAGGGPDHLLGIRELLDCIAEGRAPVPSARHAIHVLEVIEAARESARTGRTVTIGPPASDLAPVWSHEAT
jgi:predicted dehydrogenase